MGGYNSGGRNRTHSYTNQCKQLDSFYFGKGIPLMEEKEIKSLDHTISWKDGGSIAVVLHPGKLDVGYAAGAERKEIHDTFYFDSVPNNYGGADRYYFECPECGRRCRFLYLHKQHFKCRKCADLNYSRQRLNNTNEDIATYKMRKLLHDGFKVKGALSPMDASTYRPDRPKGMHQKTYMRLRMQLLRAQQDYISYLWAFVGRLYARQ